MRIGALLLTREDSYLVHNRLPAGPYWDKEWLKYLVDHSQGIKASATTLADMPEWITQKYDPLNYDLNLGIKTLYQEPPDLLLVTRSAERGDMNHQFFMDGWEKVEVEVYRRVK